MFKWSKEYQERLAARRALIRKLGIKTGEDRDRIVDRFIERAIALEEKRDACAWESPEYWKFHDRAVVLHERASLLMA